MEAYTSFAAVYEMFMDNIPYSEWGEYITQLLQQYNIENGILLDLGCGTGSLTREMATRGFDMIGVDNSEDMLSEAIARENEQQQNILYLLQDMREFELYGTVKAVVSVCDCLNYITESEDLLTVFQLVNNYLDPQGLFIFDLNTIHKYRDILGDNVIAESREEGSFIWENYYDDEERINEYNLSIFVPEGELYRKYEEVHFQKAYEIAEISSLLAEAGLELVQIYDAFTWDAPREDSERVYFIARECQK